MVTSEIKLNIKPRFGIYITHIMLKLGLPNKIIFKMELG